MKLVPLPDLTPQIFENAHLSPLMWGLPLCFAKIELAPSGQGGQTQNPGGNTATGSFVTTGHSDSHYWTICHCRALGFSLPDPLSLGTVPVSIASTT